MENVEKSSNVVYKRGNTPFLPIEPVENLAKKRPSSTKLDIEKMYEESLELATHYKKLMKENQQLKEQYQRVESIKLNRQNLIAVVQKIVEEKSKELNGKQNNHFSWLVFKLNNKIYDMRAKIEAKEKAIREITLSRESQMIRQKETQIECLNEIIDFARGEGFVKPGFSAKDSPELSQIKEIVWMEQQIKEKQTQIIEAEKTYLQEEKEVRRLMQQLAKKKAELKSIKEMQNEYHRAQELYKQEKRKKEQRIAGNKSYLEELQNQRAEELKKLDQLKNRYAIMQQEENQSIANLQVQLEKLRKEYEDKVRTKQETVIKFSEEKLPEGKKKEVKRVSFQQVKQIGKNINYMLALRGISHTEIASYFTEEGKEEYSIKQVFERLKKHPFSITRDDEALLVARYAVEDTGDGYFLEDMDTTQIACIIKSILSKLIGEVRVYSREEAENLRMQVGTVMSKFGKLVQQSLDMKEGGRDIAQRRVPSRERQSEKLFVTKQKMQQALEASLTSLQNENFLHEQIYFTIFYLFSWSRNLNELQVARLFTMVQEDINWASTS